MSLALYLCPMKQRPGGALGRMTRYCAMNDFTPDLVAAGGDWREAEIEGDKAIVRVRARDADLTALGLVFRRLSDTEAAATWTPTRLLPMWDSATGTIKTSARSTTTKTLDRLATEVPATVSADFTALLGVWAAVGFGLGWRLPRGLCAWAAAHGIEPDRWINLLLPFFDQRGVFPTTGLLDNLNRTENPLANGTWTGNWFNSAGGVAMQANGTAALSAGSFGSSFWSAATYGPDAEQFHVASVAPGIQQGGGCRLQATGTAGVDGYEYIWATTPNGQIYQIDNGAETQLTPDITFTLSAGDSLGFEGIGTTPTLTLYRKNAGTWAAQGNRTATAAYGTGHIGISADNTATAPQLDDFSGGTVVVAGGMPIGPTGPSEPDKYGLLLWESLGLV